MNGCQHGTLTGRYCGACGGVVRPTSRELKWSHYGQASRAHRESGKCKLCLECRAELYGAGEQLTLDTRAPAQAPAREAIATGRSFACLSCNLQGACYGHVQGCRNYRPSGPAGSVDV